jgi:hypothetical protein
MINILNPIIRMHQRLPLSANVRNDMEHTDTSHPATQQYIWSLHVLKRQTLPCPRNIDY